jgi:hypothetical protein
MKFGRYVGILEVMARSGLPEIMDLLLDPDGPGLILGAYRKIEM